MQQQIDELKEANNRLSRRKRVTKKRLQTGGTLSLESCNFLASQTPFKTKRKHNEKENPGLQKRIETCCQRCGNCGEIGHNSRTCENEVDIIPSDTSN